MFFIYFIIAAAVLILFALLIKIKVFVDTNQNDITVNLKILWFIKITKKYTVEYDEKNILSLYYVKRDKRRQVATLKEIISKTFKNIPSDVTFVNLITLLTQFKGRPRNFFFRYLYKKAKYDIKIDVRLGIEDAYYTALLCGMLRALSGTVYSMTHNSSHKLITQVSPEFSKQVISVKINCIIAIAPADIIIGYIINLKNKRR